MVKQRTGLGSMNESGPVYIYKKTDPEKIRPDEEIVVCNTCHSIYKKMDKYIKH